MFGGFGQASQPSQQPLFGQTAQPAQNQPSALNLFGSSTQTSQPSLFGSGTATSQPSLFGQPGSTATSAVSTGLFGSTPASQPASTGLFGSTSVAQPASTGLFGATSIAQPASTGLFGATQASQPASTGLFGTTSIAQPASTGLFGGGSSTPGQLGSLGTSPGSLLTSTPQPKTPLFGQTSTPNASTTPLSLFGGQPTQTQTPLFGSNLGSTSQAPVGLFSGTASTQPQQNTMNPIATTPFTGKNSPLEQEVPQQLINLLDILRDTVKKNFEYTPKSSLAQAETNDLNELMTNAEYYMGVVKKSSKDASLDAKGFIEKATGDVCKCKDLIEINKQRKLHPSQASEQALSFVVQCWRRSAFKD
ncbi:hypothetical protein M3Y97_00397400 [Aphelenchoides bicaudatus]|nr:hypothetical protein M3Y97_00397400 [Aphelenchoides bicaudatus]